MSRDIQARGSVWPLLATELMAAQGVPVAFVPCAKGTTALYQWVKDATAPYSRATLYGSMLRRARAVGGRVRAVLFWQGEADARAHTPRATYETLLLQFVTDVATDFHTQVVAAQIGDFDPARYDAQGVDAIRLAQQDAWSTGQGIAPGPVLYDIDLANSVHFIRGPDFATAAHRWTAAILGGVFKREVGRDPRLLEARYDGDLTITLTFDSAPAPLLLGVVDGVVVRADGQPVALSGATATAGDTVTLVLAAPSQLPLTVTLGSGRDSAGAAVPRESSVWGLPALVFVNEPVSVISE